MFGIQIDNRLIFREVSRTLNRDTDTIAFDFSIEPLLGSTLSESSLKERCGIHIAFSKTENPEIWKNIKDADSETLIRVVYCTLMEWAVVFFEELPPILYTVVSDPIKGEVKTQSLEQASISDGYILKQKYEEVYGYFLPLLELLIKYDIHGVVEI